MSTIVFDNGTKNWQREYAARNKAASRNVDYLRDAVGERIADRILDIKRSFNEVLDLGSGAGHVSKFLDDEMARKLILADTCNACLQRDVDEARPHSIPTERILLRDPEVLSIDFKPERFDAVVSSMYLHWINDLPKLLRQVNTVLKPDGVFLGAMLGGDTLYELRCALQLAEQEVSGGIAPRVSPMIESKDLAGLLKQTNYVITTVDVDEIVVHYPSPEELVQDLKAMGESNAVLRRKPFLGRNIWRRAVEIYKEMYGTTKDGQSHGAQAVPATFQIHYFIGWKPSSTTPQPLPRGSAQKSLKDALQR